MLRKVILPVAVIFSCGSYICLTASCFIAVGDGALDVPQNGSDILLCKVIYQNKLAVTFGEGVAESDGRGQ